MTGLSSLIKCTDDTIPSGSVCRDVRLFVLPPFGKVGGFEAIWGVSMSRRVRSQCDLVRATRRMIAVG